jgi:hypothetical protein
LGVILKYGGLLTAGKEELFSYGVGVIFLGLGGIAATSWLRNRYLWGTEVEEYQSLVPDVDFHVINRDHLKRTVLSLDALLGGMSGVSGVVVGSCAAGVVLNIQATEAGNGGGAEYIFLVLMIFGYPLFGALLGALGGILTTTVFRRSGEDVVHQGWGVIVALLVGFVIGTLFGVALFIALILYGLYG